MHPPVSHNSYSLLYQPYINQSMTEKTNIKDTFESMPGLS